MGDIIREFQSDLTRSCLCPTILSVYGEHTEKKAWNFRHKFIRVHDFNGRDVERKRTCSAKIASSVISCQLSVAFVAWIVKILENLYSITRRGTRRENGRERQREQSEELGISSSFDVISSFSNRDSQNRNVVSVIFSLVFPGQFKKKNHGKLLVQDKTRLLFSEESKWKGHEKRGCCGPLTKRQYRQGQRFRYNEQVEKLLLTATILILLFAFFLRKFTFASAAPRSNSSIFSIWVDFFFF